MNIGERVAKYLGRDFSVEQAQILVLMEEAAIALFSALPEHFVLFGGATLVLFHNEERSTKWTGQLHFEKKHSDRPFCDPTTLRVATGSSNPPPGTRCAGKNDGDW